MESIGTHGLSFGVQRCFGAQLPPPGTQTPITHWLAGAQSAADWQGNAHFPYCVLHLCSPQVASVWQGSASSPGVAIEPVGAAVGAGAGAGAGAGDGIGAGAGVGAYVGTGAAAVGAGAGGAPYGAAGCGGYWGAPVA
jgi:hypothetical protein